MLTHALQSLARSTILLQGHRCTYMCLGTEVYQPRLLWAWFPLHLKMAANESDEQPSKKQRKGEDFSLNFDFTNADTLDPKLTWTNPPASCNLENGVGLRVCPKPKMDFWRKTFRTPPADSASGHALVYSIPEGVTRCVAQTNFTLKDKVQYDQAGLMVFVDDQHWLKTGIEVEGGVANMSCVVTNLESDWSYKTWPTTQDVRIEVEIKWYAGFIECLVKHGDQESSGWSFLREAPISLPSDGEVKVGVMCCAPKMEEGGEAGMEAIFKCLTVQGEY